MTRSTLYHVDPKKVRDSLNHARAVADQIHYLEAELINALMQTDQDRYFVRYGFNSLRGFCVQGLRFSKTQGQRLVKEVRQSPRTSG
jgi:hypothetical protein